MPKPDQQSTMLFFRMESVSSSRSEDHLSKYKELWDQYDSLTDPNGISADA